MHPGPMNRGVEIDPRVADSDAALVTDQVRAGLVVRMAVLYDVLTVGAGRRRREPSVGGRLMLVARNGRSRLARPRGPRRRAGPGHRRVRCASRSRTA